MTVTSKCHGRDIVWSDRTGWISADGEQVEPQCKHCGEIITDMDPCVGNLPGVVAACCGHGIRENAYILFDDGTLIRGFTVGNSAETECGRDA